MKLILLAFLMPFLPSTDAAVVPRVAFEQLVADSPRIVHARVLDSYVASSGQFLWTHYRLQVLDSMKGGLPAEVTVSEPGGTLNGLSMEVSGAVELQPTEEVVLFLYQTPIGYWRVRGLWQGKFEVTNSPTGKRVRTTVGDPGTLPNARAATGISVNSLNGTLLTDFLSAIRRQLGQ
jgi:hypothetical protein